MVADSFLKEEGGEKSPWLLTLSRSPSAFLSSLALQRTGALLFLSLYCRYIFFSPPLLATLFCLFVCNTALLCKHITHGPRAVQTADCSKMLPNHRGPESFFKSKEKKKNVMFLWRRARKLAQDTPYIYVHTLPHLRNGATDGKKSIYPNFQN